jgi:hypothetical protein
MHTVMNDVGYYLLASFGSICVLLKKKSLKRKELPTTTTTVSLTR